MNTKSFSFSEPQKSIIAPNSSFFISEGTKPLPVIFRVLSGSCIIINNNSEESFSPKNNYFLAITEKMQSKILTS